MALFVVIMVFARIFIDEIHNSIMSGVLIVRLFYTKEKKK